MSLSLDDVKRLAELTRLQLSDEELETRRVELERVLEYVDRLARVDTAGIPEAEGREELTAWRTDQAEPASSNTRDQIIASFPDHVQNALRVPAVFSAPKK